MKTAYTMARGSGRGMMFKRAVQGRQEAEQVDTRERLRWRCLQCFKAFRSAVQRPCPWCSRAVVQVEP